MKVDYSANEDHLLMLANALNSAFNPEVCRWLSVTGDEGDVRCVIAFHNFTLCSCEISVAAFHPRPVTRDCLRKIFQYPFIQCGLRRIHSVVRINNAKSLELTAKLGLKVEGYVKHWYPDCDGIFHGMLREDCKWL